MSFDYALQGDGTRPAGYNAKFYKVKSVVAHHYAGGYDYSILQLAENVTGVPITQLRHDIPAAGEQIFGIHHPNGAPKKLSIPHPAFDTVSSSGTWDINVPTNFHVSGGSSGSGLFDAAGRICGVLSHGDPCSGYSLLSYFPVATMLGEMVPTPPAPVTRDVMIVFDRSGSMSLDDGTGRTKIDAARDAVSLFVQLVKSGTGNRAGFVSFSTTASSPVDFPITSVTDPHKQTLVGAAPYSGGIVGALVADGTTTIGGGLQAAKNQFPTSTGNPRAILLMTDGLQNTPPWIADVDLTGIDVHAIGFGSASNLDGAILNTLATTHNGFYLRAGYGLALEKFFSHAFGNIFEAGILFDPEYDLAEGKASSDPQPFHICGEDAVTVVAGWNNPTASLFITVKTPGGATITGASAGVHQSVGRTWTFLRIPLPQGGERDGVWQVIVNRPGGGGEFPPPQPALRFFLSVLPTGGPHLRRLPDRRRYYSGMPMNPLVELRYDDGSWPKGAKVKLTVTCPDGALGSILSRGRLRPPRIVAGDTIPARQATALAMEQEGGKPIIGSRERAFTLSALPADTNGRFEPAGVFGKRIPDLFVTEGDYTFHAVAEYGTGCVVTREVSWSIHIDCGIDPSKSDTTVDPSRGTITIRPRDSYGNDLGPGRAGDITVAGAAGTTITGSLVDNGDGTYTVPAKVAPGMNGGVIVTQPDRPPVTLTPPATTTPTGCVNWQILSWFLILVIIVLLVALILK